IPQEKLLQASEEELLKIVQQESSSDYTEGYIKGVHDVDATKILHVLVHKDYELGLLTFSPKIRGYAQYFWNSLASEVRKSLDQSLKASGEVLSIFPNTREYDFLILKLSGHIRKYSEDSGLFSSAFSEKIAAYIFEELQGDNNFVRSSVALSLKEDFLKALKEQQADLKFKKSYEAAPSYEGKIRLVKQWVSAFVNSMAHPETSGEPLLLNYVDEVVCRILFEDESVSKSKAVSPGETIEGLIGDHPGFQEGIFNFNYHSFIVQLEEFVSNDIPAYNTFRKAKQEMTKQLKDDLKLEELQPKVLTSFVRNKLIDQVYFPLFGDNLAKQLGTVGDKTRTDRSGMLLLISPPGYGKTSLMEDIADRLGLVFIRINGPAIGHEITSVDPMSATNSAAREELKKLNLAFEMGNNVMLYLDDIQHCNPEFLQKFISLSDGTRKIEGVFNGKSKTYDLRGKKFCVIMAGNPYTETGDKFRIPDMLANRADIYNLGDIIGDTEHLFKLSLIENSLTANPLLQQLSSTHFDDVYTLIDRIENNTQDTQLTGSHTAQEVQEYTLVLKKVIDIRDTVLKVNAAYIKSAAMEDEYRTQPT
ncbi:MAG TPA: AAA family ATPase, partial [Gillisia sp.]|nr:AAA family ATPase [Gillisia sp.]